MELYNESFITTDAAPADVGRRSEMAAACS